MLIRTSPMRKTTCCNDSISMKCPEKTSIGKGDLWFFRAGGSDGIDYTLDP